MIGDCVDSSEGVKERGDIPGGEGWEVVKGMDGRW